MIQLRCTKKVQDLLSFKKQDLSQPSESNHVLGNWFVNYFRQDRRNILVFMSEKTLLSFVIVGVTKSTSRQVFDAFPTCLQQLLMLEGFGEDQASKVVETLHDIDVAPTANRILNGNMNDLMFMYQNHIERGGGLKHCDLNAIIYRVNRTPQRNIGWGYSITATKKLLISET